MMDTRQEIGKRYPSYVGFSETIAYPLFTDAVPVSKPGTGIRGHAVDANDVEEGVLIWIFLSLAIVLSSKTNSKPCYFCGIVYYTRGRWTDILICFFIIWAYRFIIDHENWEAGFYFNSCIYIVDI